MRPKIYLRAQTIDLASEPNELFRARVSFENDRYYILQLDGPMTPTRRAALTQAGVVLGGYYPRDAYLADITRTSPKALEELRFVRWAGVYRDAWKLDPSIGHRLTPFQSKERQELASQGMLRLTVVLMPGGDVGRAVQALRLIGATILARNTIGTEDVVTVEVDANQLPAIAAIAEVRYVEESAEITFRNSTTRWIVQSNQVNVTPLYDNGLTGLGQIVGIMDGRVDIDHCSFFDDAPIGPDHRKVEAYNTTLGGDFHGTHVAGIVVGDAGAFDNTRGVAYEGRFVFNTPPTFAGAAMYGDLLAHQNQGARIHTNSWGNDATTAYDGLARGIDLFSRDFEDNLVLFAVTNLSVLRNPENAKNVLAVGASQDTPDQGSHCSGGVGPTSDGRRKPEVYAPGCLSTSSKAGTSCDVFSDTGTSMACPAVAGVAMLIRQYFVNGYYLSGTANPAGGFVPTGAIIKATLLNSATDMTGVPGYPSNLEGWGRVLGDDALYFRDDARSLIVLDDLWNASGLSTGEERLYELRVVDSAEPLRITLVWTDAPASVGAGFAAVNDLDLEVTSPGAMLYLGNVFSGGASVSGGLPDDRNNVEQVHVTLPATGTWMIRVRGTAVNDGTQGFALIATGDIARSCMLATDCDDLYPCTFDDCDGTGACVYTPDPGLTCDDGSLCTSGDTCTVDGDCVGVPLDAAVDCDDGIACTVDTCSPLDGCVNRSVPGMACDDDDACTINDTCQPGTDCIGTPVDPSVFCDDGSICTVDTCAWDVGCVLTPIPGLGCEDNDDCTLDDQCDVLGVCTGTPIVILFGDVQPPPGTVDIDDLLYVLAAFAVVDQCGNFPDANLFPCNAPCSASPIDLDDILAVLSAFASNSLCPDECPLR